MIANPFAGVPKADARADQRRQRRSLTEDELTRLLYVAQLRPLAEYGRETIRKDAQHSSGRRTWKRTALESRCHRRGSGAASLDRLRSNPEFANRLETLGRERAIVYKTLVLTGLRKGELASLTVGQAHVEEPMPCLDLAAADEKNRQGSQIPLRADLAAELKESLNERSDRVRDNATIPLGSRAADGLPADTPLLRVPAGLVRILDRDLRAAGIPKRDARGWAVDVHALRHSFGTLLSKGGVAPRTAQAAMRHSTIDLTMNVYTDPKLLDVQGALDALPALPLDRKHRRTSVACKATGTNGSQLAPTSGDSCQIRSIGGKSGDGRRSIGPIRGASPERLAPSKKRTR